MLLLCSTQGWPQIMLAVWTFSKWDLKKKKNHRHGLQACLINILFIYFKFESHTDWKLHIQFIMRSLILFPWLSMVRMSVKRATLLIEEPEPLEGDRKKRKKTRVTKDLCRISGWWLRIYVGLDILNFIHETWSNLESHSHVYGED